ncbi:hypothetical protein [Candidatus Neoehrlichia procyonis]|nr:hypothetical protein [Candidatus Neoehrlichia lotoris]
MLINDVYAISGFRQYCSNVQAFYPTSSVFQQQLDLSYFGGEFGVRFI